jgi:hypothetical protein
MINKKQIAELAKSILRRQRGLKDPQLMHPSREWVTGLFIALIIFVLCALWSVQSFVRNRNISSEQVGVDVGETTVYRKSMVDAALQEFAKRETKFQALLNMSLPVSKPAEIKIPDTQVELAASTSEPEIVSEPEAVAEEGILEEGI